MSEPVRPVLLEAPLQGQKWVNQDGTATHYGHRWNHSVFMRLGAYEDSVWRSLGVGYTGLTQINQVSQRVAEIEAATAAAQGAIAGLRGDPRLEKAVDALGIAITALAQVQARASGETEKRLNETESLVSSFGARLTKATQAVQMQVDNLQIEAKRTLQYQTGTQQRIGSAQLALEDQIGRLEGGFEALARTSISGAGAIDYDSSTGVIDLPTQPGWTAPTGTATRTSFDTATVTLPQLAERVKAMVDDLTTSSIIGA